MRGMSGCSASLSFVRATVTPASAVRLAPLSHSRSPSVPTASPPDWHDGEEESRPVGEHAVPQALHRRAAAGRRLTDRCRGHSWGGLRHADLPTAPPSRNAGLRSRSPRQHQPQADETHQALRRDPPMSPWCHRFRDPKPRRCPGRPRLLARAAHVLRLGGGHPISVGSKCPQDLRLSRRRRLRAAAWYSPMCARASWTEPPVTAAKAPTRNSW